jgi:hypothetical protein
MSTLLKAGLSSPQPAIPQTTAATPNAKVALEKTLRNMVRP